VNSSTSTTWGDRPPVTLLRNLCLKDLWPVSDSVTRELMTSYYRRLKAGLGRGDALRQARLAMLHRKGREHPFYWASFMQAGKWANLEEKR
jgi:CHAT domain-containing protein